MGIQVEPDGGPATREAEAERIENSGGVSYSVALERRAEGPASVLAMELTIGPTDSDDRIWDYGDFLLAAGWVPGPEAGEWLAKRAGDIRGRRSAVSFEFPELRDAGTWERCPSRSARDDLR